MQSSLYTYGICHSAYSHLSEVVISDMLKNDMSWYKEMWFEAVCDLIHKKF